MNHQDLQTKLLETLTGRTAIVGIGNVDLGDDGVGVRLAEELSSAGLPDILITHTVPEDYLPILSCGGFENVVFLDAVKTNAEPGSVVILDATEVKNRFPQISTHKLTLGTLARLIEAESLSRVWLLGIQPETVKQGKGLSEPVETTLNLLKILLLDILQQRKVAEEEWLVS